MTARFEIHYRQTARTYQRDGELFVEGALFVIDFDAGKSCRIDADVPNREKFETLNDWRKAVALAQILQTSRIIFLTQIHPEPHKNTRQILQAQANLVTLERLARATDVAYEESHETYVVEHYPELDEASFDEAETAAGGAT